MRNTNTTNLHQFRIDYNARLLKRSEGYEAIELGDITHKTYFFPENLRGTRKYYEILRVISPLFSCMFSYPKRISNGLTIIGLEKDISALLKELRRVIDIIEGDTQRWRLKVKESAKKDEHLSHLIADHRDKNAFTIRSDSNRLVSYLWGKRIVAHENRDKLEAYFEQHLKPKKHRKVKWQTV